MVRLLGLTRGEPAESPREVTRTIPTSEDIGESGWLIRFFDSAFFCEWIAVSYLYKHDHPGVRDYLCNRMYTLPLSGIQSYLFQICYMMVHKPSPSLDKFVIDVCSKSLHIALKVHWFLMAELEDTDDNEGISRLQEKCQIAATLMGEWPPLIKPQNSSSTSMGKNQVLNKLLSSKQKLLSLTSSPPAAQRSLSFSPSSGSSLPQDDGIGSKISSPEENKIFKKLMPGPKVRDALLFRKSVEKDDEEPEKDSFLKRLLRDSRDEDVRKLSDKDDAEPERDGFFKRFLRESRDDDSRKSVDKDEEESEKDGFFRRLLSNSKDDDARNSVDKDAEESEKDGFFRRLLSSSRDDEEDVHSSTDGFFKRIFRDNKNDLEDKAGPKPVEDDEKDGFFRKFLKDKEKKDVRDKNEIAEKSTRSSEDDEKEGFFKKFFKEKSEDKKDWNDRTDEDIRRHANGEEEESSDFSLFRRLFRVHPEDPKSSTANESCNGGNFLESSPGTENFFRKLFKDRDRSVEDSELFGSKKNKEKRPGSPKQHERLNAKPPLPDNGVSQFRKGAYHQSLDFVQSLCDTSYGLVDVFPVEDRKSALCESLAEINAHLADAQNSGGVCFPMGKGMYRVLHIPEDEAVLLNSREKAPYLICVEVLKCESPNTKDTSNPQKLSKGGIPLANGDVLLPKPPPWAYPLWTGQDMYHNGFDRMSMSASQAIDQAMTQLWDAKVKFVRVNFSVEKQSESAIDHCSLGSASESCSQCREVPSLPLKSDAFDPEWVRVILTVDPGVRMEDIVDQDPPRKKEHRRVPSTVAIEEVKLAALKGEAPPGLPLKGAGQDSSDAQPKVTNGGLPKVSDALSGELWEVKKERIRKCSVYGKVPGWDLRSNVEKEYPDLGGERAMKKQMIDILILLLTKAAPAVDVDFPFLRFSCVRLASLVTNQGKRSISSGALFLLMHFQVQL
ncbi:phosphatidylinositol 4-kinase beta 1 isoform X2 [Nicotiana sylvestris]|uniref:phosphatidylinositol 4-kinase beta 1 isoform X2 n=1 Tax=Nicotiana sylvestris TaxID=4096 RepID=UPI00388CAB42